MEKLDPAKVVTALRLVASLRPGEKLLIDSEHIISIQSAFAGQGAVRMLVTGGSREETYTALKDVAEAAKVELTSLFSKLKDCHLYEAVLKLTKDINNLKEAMRRACDGITTLVATYSDSNTTTKMAVVSRILERAVDEHDAVFAQMIVERACVKKKPSLCLLP